MQNYYPNQTELATPDRLERVFRSTFDRLYNVQQAMESSLAAIDLKFTALQAATTPAAISDALSVSGEAPLSLQGLLGLAGTPQHAYIPSVTSLPIVGDPLYGNAVSYQGTIWVFDPVTQSYRQIGATAYVSYGVYAARPAVTVADNGKLYYATNWKILFIVNTGAWCYAAGILQNTYANRPAVTTEDNGLPFYATDQNTLYIVEAGAWVWQAGCMADTIAPDHRPTLAAADAGFLFYGTDDTQLYRWSGAGWVYYIPDASTTVRGVVTIGTQSFLGTKTLTGITKLGDGAIHYSNFDTSGRFTSTGNARVHREFRVAVIATRNGASAPADAFRAVGASGTVLMPVKQFSKTTQQDIYWIFHAPSDMDYTAPANFHLMWQPGAGWTTGNFLWKLEYLALAENAVLLAGAPTTLQADVTPADALHIIETDFTGDITLALDQVMICHFYRDVAGDNGDDVGSVSLLELNYIMNKLGEPI